MRNKVSAQISIFIIIGIMIILISFLFISTKYDFKINQVETISINNQLSPETEIVEIVEYCLERQANHALNWAFFENGNYEVGTATQMPDFPTLLKYDLWFHTFDVRSFNRDGISNSMEIYLLDTMPNCLKDLDDFYLDLEIEKTQLNFAIYPYNSSVEIQMYYPVILNNSGEIITINNFNVVIENVPIAQTEKDVNEIVNWFNQYVQSVDGKTDGKSEMKWGDPGKAIEKLESPSVFQRDDVMVIFSEENVEDFEFYLYYKPQFWKESFFIFNIDGSTLESIDKDEYYNNVLNRQKSQGELNPITIDENYKDNEVYKND